MGQLAGAAARAISDGNKSRLQRLEVADGLIQFFPCSAAAWWEKFKGQRWLWIAENIADVHNELRRRIAEFQAVSRNFLTGRVLL